MLNRSRQDVFHYLHRPAQEEVPVDPPFCLIVGKTPSHLAEMPGKHRFYRPFRRRVQTSAHPKLRVRRVHSWYPSNDPLFAGISSVFYHFIFTYLFKVV